MMSYEGYMCKSINFVCMCTCSLVPRPRTMVIGLGTRLLCNGKGRQRGKEERGEVIYRCSCGTHLEWYMGVEWEREERGWYERNIYRCSLTTSQ